MTSQQSRWGVGVCAGARTRRAIALGLAALLAVPVALVAGAAPAGAVGPVITVDTTQDLARGDCGTAGQCSLRAAIAAANGTTGATVHVPSGQYVLDGGGGGDTGDIDIKSPMTILGAARPPGIDATEVRGSGDRVFEVSATGVVMRGIYVTGGNARTGGGIQVSRGAGLAVEDSTVSFNGADEGAGIHNDGTLVVRRSTVRGNTAVRKGGALLNNGAATVVNSTLHDNSAQGGGGIASAGTATVAFTTITANATTNRIGGGLYRIGGTFDVIGTIVAENQAHSSDSHDCSGSPNFTGLNLIGLIAGCNPTGTMPLTGTTGLAAIADNGGATLTRALDPDSQAVDVITDCPGAELQDQRGVARPAGSGCDLGSYEHAPLAVDVDLTASATDIGAGAETVPVEDVLAAVRAAAAQVSNDTTTQSTILRSVILRSVILRSVILRSVILRSVDPASTILRSVILRSVILRSVILRSVILRSVILRSVILRSVLLSDIELLEQTWQDYIAAHYPELVGVPLQNLTLGDLIPTDADGNIIGDPAAADLSLADMDLSDTVLGSISLPALFLGDQTLDTLEGVDWCAVLPEYCSNLASTTLLAASIEGAILRSVPVEDVILRSVDWLSSPLADIRLADLGASVPVIVDCDAVDCTDGNLTLGQIGTANAEHIIGTLGDILLAIFGTGQIQWDQLELGPPTRLQPFASPLEPRFTYTATVTVTGSAADTDLDLTLPTGFEFESGTATLDGEALADPTRPNPSGNALTFDLGTLGQGAHEVTVDVWAGLQLGSKTASAVATAVAGTQSDTSDAATASIDVGEAFESAASWGTESEARSELPSVATDVLHLAHISTPGDVDLYHFRVSDAEAASGATASILLSNLPADYDLVLYGPPFPSLRGEPDHALTLAGDHQLDLAPGDDGLDPELAGETILELPFPTDEVVHRVSARRGTADDRIDTGPLRAGDYWIQVAGHDGARSNEPYALRRQTLPGVVSDACAARTFPFDSGGVSVPSSYEGDPQSLFLVDVARFVRAHGPAATQDMLDALGGLVARPDVAGRIVRLDSTSAVSDAFAAWDANRCSVAHANAVVRAIGDVIDAEMEESIEHVVLVGDDALLPMGRVPDGTALSNESTYAPSIPGENELSAALRQGYVLTDDVYGTPAGISVADHELYLPQMSVGRVGETPAEIEGIIEDFVGYGGRLDPATALVTGYDFLDDGSEAISSALTGAGLTVQELIDPPDCAPDCWTTAQLAQAVAALADPAALLSLNAHFDHSRGLSSAEDAGGTTADLFDPTTLSELPPSVIFSMGCHSGLSVSDVTIGAPGEDWAQAMTGAGHAWIGNTGYGYGDTELVALSERLMALLAGELSGATVGEALARAKQLYARDLVLVTPYDEKVLQQSTLYGLPMFTVGGDGGAALASSFEATSTDDGPPLYTDPAPPRLRAQDHTLDFSGRLARADTAGGSYYHVDGRTLNVQHRPVQPLDSMEITRRDPSSGALTEEARGVLVTSLSSSDIDGFEPLYFRPVVDLGDHEPRAEAEDATFPASSPAAVTTVAGSDGIEQHLTVVPGQFREPTAPGTGTQRLYSQVGTHVYFVPPGAPDGPAPTILDADVTLDDAADSVRFDVHTSGDAVRMLVLSKSTGMGGAWAPTDLVEVADGHWVGSRSIAGSATIVEAVFQGVSSTGRVAWAANKGRNYVSDAGSVGSDISIELSSAGVAVNGWYPAAVTVAVQPSGVSGLTYTLDGDGPHDYTGPFDVESEGLHTVVVTNGSADTASFGVDATAPTVVHAVDGLGGGGFYSGDVDVTLTASDGSGSGVVTLTYSIDGGTPVQVAGPSSTFTVPAGTSPVSVSYFATDLVGHSGDAEVLTLQFDSTPPTATCDSADGAWHGENVTLTCAATDGGSGVEGADATGAYTFTVSTTVGEGVADDNASTSPVEICDIAGNCADLGTVSGNKIDRLAPTATITTPAAGAFYPGGTTVAADYSCDDGTPGAGMTGGSAACLATVSGPGVSALSVADGANLPTANRGTYTVSLTPVDAVGNTGTPVVAAYTVGYGVCLLYDPAKASPQGSAYPVKLQICDSTGNLSKPNIVLEGLSIDGDESALQPNFTGSSNADFFFRYDSKLKGYIYNLDTTLIPVVGPHDGAHSFEFSVDGVAGYVVFFRLK